jgi:peptidoglycan/xylan/chitin deacetylase (PgdA/CDA1 family)
MKKHRILSIGLLLTAGFALLLSIQSISKKWPHAKAALVIIPEKTVTLTFDDGPDPRFTPTVLQILSDYQVNATFFVVGQNTAKHPDLVRRIAAEGHALANHTYTHPHLEEFQKDQVVSELTAADRIMTEVAGRSAVTPYFRPPRGNISSNILQSLKLSGKQMVLWNVCVENSSTHTPEEVRSRVMREIRERNGGIILAHDGDLDRSLTVQSLPLILRDLKQEGYRIVTLSDYLEQQTRKAKEDIGFVF